MQPIWERVKPHSIGLTMMMWSTRSAIPISAGRSGTAGHMLKDEEDLGAVLERTKQVFPRTCHGREDINPFRNTGMD